MHSPLWTSVSAPTFVPAMEMEIEMKVRYLTRGSTRENERLSNQGFWAVADRVYSDGDQLTPEPLERTSRIGEEMGNERAKAKRGRPW